MDDTESQCDSRREFSLSLELSTVGTTRQTRHFYCKQLIQSEKSMSGCIISPDKHPTNRRLQPDISLRSSFLLTTDRCN